MALQLTFAGIQKSHDKQNTTMMKQNEIEEIKPILIGYTVMHISKWLLYEI